MTSTGDSSRLLRVSLASLAFAAWVQSPLLLSQSSRSSVQAISTFEGRQVVAGEVLVQFKSAAATAGHERILADQVDAELNVPVGRHGLRRLRSRAFDVETMLAFFRARPEVDFAEPNYVVRAQLAPNDPQFGSLWGLLNIGQRIVGTFGTPGADISATAAWDVSTGSTDTVIGVIDSGIDYTHPDLAANVWSAPAPFSVTIGGTTIQCPAGSHGFNAIDKTCDPMDDFSHGTHVAGTIGAVGNNGIGVAGVNWNATMIGGRFLDDFGVGTTADAIDAIDFMIQTKMAFAPGGGANIRVLNNSWGGGAFSVALRSMIELAASHDMLFVAAAGNSARDTDAMPHYPSGYDVPSVIAVAATTNQDFLWPSSNHGATSVDLAAPGEWVLSTIPGNGYAFRSGTSMATPHVAGAAALILSACDLDTSALRNALLTTVDGVASLTGLVATGGRLNVNRAIRTCGAPALPSAPIGVAATGGQQRIDLTWGPVSTATSYNIKRSVTSGGPYDSLASVSSTTYSDLAVAPGQTFFYVVSAVNALGEGPDSSEVSARILDAPPGPPQKLHAIPGDARVTLTWQAPERATAFRIKRAQSKDGPYGLIAITEGVSFTDLWVTNGTKYYYVVSAFNAAGEGGDSGKASAFVAPVPQAPAGLTSVAGSDSRTIDLAWTPADWATSYRIRRSDTSGGPYTGVRKVTSPSFTDTGLRTGRRYFYVVTALNASGESAESIEVSAIAK